MELYAGTSGYAYKEWKGPFYPEDLPAREMLAHYASRLPAVEINNTFYRLPKASVLESWREQVPAGFRFAVKASRRITHFGRLKEGADEPTGYLLQTVASLGESLGLLFFQLPPNFPQDLERLERFLGTLPEGTRAAFEFRHPSWFDEPTFALLRARGFPLVAVDADDEDACAPIVATGTVGYLRLRRSAYDRAALSAWAAKIRAQDWSEAYVFFKHEDEGAGPALAMELLEVAGRAAERKPAAARHPERKREAG